MKHFSVFVLLFAIFVLVASADETSEEKTSEEKTSEEKTAEEKTAEEICRQPQIRGKCRALIPRFYYNIDSGECENFGYGGCGGNDNNFATKDECEAKCKGIKKA